MRFPLKLVVFRVYVNVIEVNLKKTWTLRMHRWDWNHTGPWPVWIMTSGPGGAPAPLPRRAESAAGAGRSAGCAATGEEGDPGRTRGATAAALGFTWVQQTYVYYRMLEYLYFYDSLHHFTSMNYFLNKTYIILVFRIIWWNLWMDSVHFWYS